ncbi:hypothetical protein BDV96DRAFT_642255 [Lophiotrema nucula]|uniref:DUF7580 domain-containing protein n=1 Tax=Lophiotrema nucula TaxID=690887 RepID=A0A6A5ZK27_9PLEO|nr:hypothetical protein BDV96DRAFT_642255 [Lophiotrema nucula]
MSGLEIAGVLLGTFPLIISGLEHYRDVAKVAGFFWQVRKKYQKCRSDVLYHELIYKRNLKELLLPLVSDSEEVNRLIAEPGGQRWNSEALQQKLEERLQESYSLYIEIVNDMNETAEELRKELSFDQAAIQDKVNRAGDAKKQKQQQAGKQSRTASMKANVDYQMFRVKFSLGESVREELFAQLKQYNERLEKLLGTSDKVSMLQSGSIQSGKNTSVMETAFRNAWKKSDLLFRALQNAWNCSCQQYHFANLRLEHRTLSEICFEIILMFVAPSDHGNTPWAWEELQCGQLAAHACASPKVATRPTNGSKTTIRQNSHGLTSILPRRAKTVAFSLPQGAVPQIELDSMSHHDVELCKLLSDNRYGVCMGVIGHDGETYHLHPSTKRIQHQPNTVITLDQILSDDFDGHVSRRQRYAIALLLASSVAQLQFTPWLRTGLTKEDVLFLPSESENDVVPYGEPFIRQGFAAPFTESDASDCNFYSLGILLLELCFGKRLEDYPLRRRHPAGEGDTKNAFDLMAALRWSAAVVDEGGGDYASAVKWCFTGSANSKQQWRSEIIRNVIQPLEHCQQHFNAALT